MTCIICPLCHLVLDRQSKVWSCTNGHSFDVARQGYVNLLVVQHKNSREPGDNQDMVMARREFLQAGYYQPLRDAVTAWLQPLLAELPAHADGAEPSLLDIGCGEGYYTSALHTLFADVIGLDIAKPAIQLAARRFQEITWLVGSGAQLPVADQSMDVVSSLFSPLPVTEMHRVLRDDGHVLVVNPGPTHLWTMREGLFDEVRPHDPEKFLAGFEALFEPPIRQEVRFPLHLTPLALKQLLLMTPYVWKAKQERRLALEQFELEQFRHVPHDFFETEAVFSLMLFKKKAKVEPELVAEAPVELVQDWLLQEVPPMCMEALPENDPMVPLQAFLSAAKQKHLSSQHVLQKSVTPQAAEPAPAEVPDSEPGAGQ